MSKKHPLLIGLVCGAISSSSFAQSGAIEEIVVTSTKRTSTLQEIPISVSVTTADTIEKAAINDLKDLQSVVPSLKINTLQGSSETNFFIRGFGNGANNPGIEPSVGLFIDGVYRSRSASAITDLPNVQRVEVLRGPQSTLFGKNASAGVISVVTAAPDGEHLGKFSATVGNFGQADFKGYVAGSISDSTAFDFSLSKRTRDGWADNLTTGSELNEVDRIGIRGQLASDISDTTSLRVIADFDQIEELCCAVTNSFIDPAVAFGFGLLGANIIANDPLSTDVRTDTDPFNEVENKGISFHVDSAFNSFDFKSITAFRSTDNTRTIDLDFTDVAVFTNSIDSSYDTFTQEFRISSNNDSSLQWLAGAFYFDESVDHRDSIDYGVFFRPLLNVLSQGAFTNAEAAFGLPPGTFFAAGEDRSGEVGTLENDSISLYTQLDWDISDRLTATFGLNYTKDEKEAVLEQFATDAFGSIDPAALIANATGLPFTTALALLESGAIPNPLGAASAFQFLPPLQSIPNAIEDGRTDDDDVTYTLRLAYDLSDTTNIYAGASTGFKSSSWNLSRDSRPTFETRAALIAAGINVPNLSVGTRFADPEESTVFEIGLKSRFERGSLFLTLFTQEIEGFQSNTFVGTGFNLANAGSQTTEGLEVEFTYYPTDSLKLGFSGTFLDAIYDEFTNAAGVGGTIVDLSGEPVPGVHETSLSLSAEYSFTIGSDWDAYVRGDFQYEDEVQTNSNVPAELSSEEFGIFNASIGAKSPNGLGIMLWGRNINDDESVTTGFPLPGVPGVFNTYRNQPRTYGVTLTKDF